MEEVERKRLQDKRRLASLALGMINTLDENISKVKDEFLNNTYWESKATLMRLSTEVRVWDMQLQNNLNNCGKEKDNG